MKNLMLFAIAIIVTMPVITAQDVYTTRNGYVSFFSEAPVADVDARNNKVKVELNPSTQEVTFTMAMTDFQFKSKKMGRDARKKYIEIDKYPQASFKGKIDGKIDYDKPGVYPATATGKMKIHGVEKEIKEKGTVTVEKGQIKLESEFRVALKDYNIETPKILGKEMTQDNVLVKIEATLASHSKKELSKK